MTRKTAPKRRARTVAPVGTTGGARAEEERTERGGEPLQPNVDRSSQDVDSAWIRGEDRLTERRTRDPVVHERAQRVGPTPVSGDYEDDDDRFDLGGRGASYLGEGGEFMTEDEGGHAEPRTADERYEERWDAERREDAVAEGAAPGVAPGEPSVASEDEVTEAYDGAPRDEEDRVATERGDRPEDRRASRRLRNRAT